MMIDDGHFIHHSQWVKTERLSNIEMQELQDRHGLTAEMVTYITDQDEQPNYVFDEHTGDELVIIHVPYVVNIHRLQYLTRPVCFLIHQGTLFTFNESELPIVDYYFDKISQQSDVDTLATFILRVLFALMDSYIPIVKAITKRRNQLDQSLNQQAQNRDLLALSYLQQTLTFFSSALQFNLTLFKQLIHSHFGHKSDAHLRAQLEDVVIEAKQVQQMIRIENRVVDRIAATFDSMINNNLNMTMKVLTIWSLTMAVPTILTGFYGMNMKLPFAEYPWAWLGVIGLSGLLILGLLLILRLHHKL